MPFITQGKANVKYLLIVVLVAVVAGGIIFAAWNYCQKEIVILNKVNNIEINKKSINSEPETINLCSFPDNIKLSPISYVDYNNDGYNDILIGEKIYLNTGKKSPDEYCQEYAYSSSLSESLSKITPTLINYCSQYNDSYLQYDAINGLQTGFYINDLSNKNERIFVLCSADKIAILENKNNRWQPVMEQDFIYGNDTEVISLNVKDFDNDGIDEIAYKIGFHSFYSAGTEYYLYSQKDNNFFYCQEISEINPKEINKSLSPFCCGNPENLYNDDGSCVTNNMLWMYSESKETWIKSNI